jgi:putative membrane protein
MKVIPLVRAEFARLTASRLGIASLIAIMLVPIVYGGLYLWGNRDPYGNLDRVPAALVVADTGATVDGSHVNYGKDAATQLLKDQAFGWKEVTESQARAGVAKGTYDFAVSFPASFSRNLASATSTAPTQASIDLRTDDTNSYLSTTIAKQATEAVRTAVAQKVGKSASRQLLDAVADIRTGLVNAKNGSSKLADGTATAASGAASLKSGLAKIDAQTSGLPAQANQLKSGAAQVASGASQSASGAKQLSAGLSTLDKGMATYGTSLTGAIESNPLLTADQKQQLLDGYAALAAGAHKSHAGAASLAAGTRTLSSGAAQVSTGTKQLAASAPVLASGIHKASAGASSLDSGVAKLDAGVTKLHDSLTTGVAKVPATSASERAAKAAQIANPATVKQHAVTTAQNYGAGLAPFFISLASWIGLYALFLLVRPLSRRALTAVRRPIRTTLAGWLTPAALGIVQAVALFLVVTLALHLKVAEPVALLGFMGLIAITFAAMILALNVLFGSVGQFLALILMIVQLVTAGGTFPWQTLPGPLAFIHQALPMSHAVDGVRVLMYGGSTSSVWGPVTFLLYWLVGSLLVAVLGATRQGRFRTLVQLRPSAIGG